jgi:hypothetical protein
VLSCLALGIAVALPGLWVLGLASALAVLVFSALLWEPTVVLLGFVATRPLADTFVRVSVGPLSLGQAWSLLLIAAIVVCLIQLPSSQSRHLWSDAVPYSFAGVYAVLTLWRPDYVLALGNSLRLLAWVLLIQAVTRIVVNDRSIRRVLASGRALGLVTVLAVVIASARGEYGLGYYFSPSRFSDFLMSGPHGLAALCVFSMAFPLVAMTTGLSSRWDLALTGSLAASALLSFTRTGILALFVVLLGVVVSAVVGRRQAIVATTVVLTAAVLTFVYALGDRLLLRVVGTNGADFISTQFSPTGGSGRIGIWLAIQARVLADPLGIVVGYGAGSTTTISRASLGIQLLAHNDFLELLISGGIGLVALYLALIVWMWVRMGVRGAEYRGMVVAARSVLVAYVVFSLLNGIVFSQASIALGLLVGMLSGQKSLAAQEQATT